MATSLFEKKNSQFNSSLTRVEVWKLYKALPKKVKILKFLMVSRLVVLVLLKTIKSKAKNHRIIRSFAAPFGNISHTPQS